MRLVKVRPEDRIDSVATAYDFRLYDDHGEPIKFVKSIALKINPSEDFTVTMVIERYVTTSDEIDVEIDPSNPDVQIVYEDAGVTSLKEES